MYKIGTIGSSQMCEKKWIGNRAHEFVGIENFWKQKENIIERLIDFSFLKKALLILIQLFYVLIQYHCKSYTNVWKRVMENVWVR